MYRKLIEKLRKDRDEFRGIADALWARVEAGEDLSEQETKEQKFATEQASALDARIAELTEQETARLDSDRRDAQLNGRWTEQAETVSLPSGPRADFASHAADALMGLRSTTGTVTVKMSVIDNRDADGKNIAGVVKVRDAVEPITVTPLLDVIAAEPVTSDDYEWEKWGLIPVAGDVAKAEGSAKPEATDGYEIVNGVLGLAAHHIGVSRRALQDKPGLEAKLRGRLARGVQLKAEGKALAALLAGVYGEAKHADGLLQAIRYGVATVQDNGYTPDTLVLNPLDMADIDIMMLSKTLNGAMRGVPTWGIQRIIAKSGVPAGTAFVGSVYDALLCTYRSEVELYMTDSHSDEFTKNRIRILAEQRLSVDLQQPNAIVKCSVGAAAALAAATK